VPLHLLGRHTTRHRPGRVGVGRIRLRASVRGFDRLELDGEIDVRTLEEGTHLMREAIRRH